MAFRITSNSGALSASRYIGLSQQKVEHSIKALASGSRIVDARDDAAGFAIAENLRGHVQGLKQARNNAENAVAFVQVAEGGLNEQNNILIRMRELGVQAASDTISDNEREFLQQEFEQLTLEFDRIAKTTRYGSKQLLAGESSPLEFHLGSNGDEDNIVRYTLEADTRASKLGVIGLDISDKSDARSALEDIDDAIQGLAGVRANFGAIQSRLQVAANHLDMQMENTENARARITDVDVADETAELMRNQIVSSFGIAVLAQANDDAKRSLQLLA